MTKIFALSGSNRKQSIHNAMLAALQNENSNITLGNLNDYQAPLYNLDDEETTGIPSSINQFIQDISDVEHLIIATPEHNGNLPVSLKNVLDWASRVNNQFLTGKKVIVLSTSPGARGGAGANQILSTMLPFFGAEVIGSAVLPSFYDTFDLGTLQIKDDAFKQHVLELIAKF